MYYMCHVCECFFFLADLLRQECSASETLRAIVMVRYNIILFRFHIIMFVYAFLILFFSQTISL